MADYIDRDKLLAHMMAFCDENCNPIEEQGMCPSCGIEEARSIVKEEAAADVVDRDNVIDTAKSWLRVNGKCPTCKRCSDNRNDGTTFCPIEESYYLPLDGVCHLYEPKEG